jgi:ribosomal subunit interface protein
LATEQLVFCKYFKKYATWLIDLLRGKHYISSMGKSIHGITMQIEIDGKNVDVGESLRTHIEERLVNHVKKYFDKAVSAHVVVEKIRHQFVISASLNDGTHHRIINSSAGDSEAYRAADLAIEKMEHQLRRYKHKLKNHHQNRHAPAKEELAEMINITLRPSPESEELQEDYAPAIVAESRVPLERLSVGDAVMRMDMLEQKAFTFINSSNNKVNVVYYRPDGNISWLDPDVASS